MHPLAHNLHTAVTKILSRIHPSNHTDNHLHSHDRLIFERDVQPYFINDPSCHNILFVGCEYYTQHYNTWYEGKNYWTFDYDPTKKRFGGRQHIIDTISNIETHFDPNSLDLILCNGVYGWGLCDRPEADKAFNGSFETLKPGGVLMIGWNDIDDKRYKIPCPPEELESLKRFQPFVFKPTCKSRIVSDDEFTHVFDFFQKPLDSQSA